VGTLYVVATPIGNLEDITLRALRILKEVPLVAAEDTRVTRTLFRAHDIHTPLTSFHEFSSASRRIASPASKPISPSSATFIRKTPWVDGCCGPIDTSINSPSSREVICSGSRVGCSVAG